MFFPCRSRRPAACNWATRSLRAPRGAAVRSAPACSGRVLDGFGQPMDGGPPVEAERHTICTARRATRSTREHITQPLVTGIRAIDGLLPCGKGQRIGIFGGSGVGKSTLLGSMSRHNSADVSVIALIGERNREVRAFLDTSSARKA